MPEPIDVRMPAEWMTAPDERLLEYLMAEGISAAKHIAADDRLRYARAYLNIRLRCLDEVGLVETYGNGVYGITETGKEFLRGRADLHELPAPDVHEQV